jgi:hypothetical protein
MEMENVGIFYGHLEYITDIWYILKAYGNLVVIWYIIPPFGILYREKSGNPAQDENYVWCRCKISSFVFPRFQASARHSCSELISRHVSELESCLPPSPSPEIQDWLQSGLDLGKAPQKLQQLQVLLHTRKPIARFIKQSFVNHHLLTAQNALFNSSTPFSDDAFSLKP